MWSLWFLIACGPSEPEPPSEAAAPEQPGPSQKVVAEAEARGEAAIAQLGETLKQRLVSTMGAEGPAAAVTLCNAEAGGLTAKVASETGVAVGRSSLKLRNPENAPTDWVLRWLKANEGRSAAEAVGTSEVAGEVVRVVRPIPVGAPCLACHGPDEGIGAEVKALLAEHYPEDQARGYAVGDLRGAFWAEVPLGE